MKRLVQFFLASMVFAQAPGNQGVQSGPRLELKVVQGSKPSTPAPEKEPGDSVAVDAEGTIVCLSRGRSFSFPMTIYAVSQGFQGLKAYDANGQPIKLIPTGWLQTPRCIAVGAGRHNPCREFPQRDVIPSHRPADPAHHYAHQPHDWRAGYARRPGGGRDGQIYAGSTTAAFRLSARRETHRAINGDAAGSFGVAVH
jgi:hypothetical protein